MSDIKFWLDSNRGPPASESTTIPTEPQSLPLILLFSIEFVDELWKQKFENKRKCDWGWPKKCSHSSVARISTWVSRRSKQHLDVFISQTLFVETFSIRFFLLLSFLKKQKQGPNGEKSGLVVVVVAAIVVTNKYYICCC